MPMDDFYMYGMYHNMSPMNPYGIMSHYDPKLTPEEQQENAIGNIVCNLLSIICIMVIFAIGYGIYKLFF